MELKYIPLFCGGRLLVGLHSLPNNFLMEALPGGGMKKHFFKNDLEFLIYNKKSCDPIKIDVKCPYIPNHLDYFQFSLLDQMTTSLPYMINSNSISSAQIYLGVITAITNGIQLKAASFLEKTGFKVKAKTSKVKGSNDLCLTWVGDVHRDIVPALAENTKNILDIANQFYENKETKSKFA